MSAYICNPEHIGLLAAYLAIKNRSGSESAQQTAEVLALENIRSVATRYPNDKSGQRPGPCLFDNEIVEAAKLWADHYTGLKAQQTTPTTILALCQCFSYQSCETEDWTSTNAFGLLEQVKSAAIRSLPNYSNVSWSWSEEVDPPKIAAFYQSIGYGIEEQQ